MARHCRSGCVCVTGAGWMVSPRLGNLCVCVCACVHPFALLQGHNPPLQSDTLIPPTPEVVLPAGHEVHVVSCSPTSAGLPGLYMPTAQDYSSTKKQTSEQLRRRGCMCVTTEPSSSQRSTDTT